MNPLIPQLTPFSVTEKYKQLSEDDKNYVKMIMKLDDHMSRIFFY
ncbi:Uncharacterised protein [Raoultella ornithinolytica]|nr:Uncharacterised protein [Raoultella ornithinolytica]